MANISQLVEQGEMIIAGPLGKNAQAYRGIFVLNTSDTLKAQELLRGDPAINEGLLHADLYPWYGSAALSEYLPAADKIWKLKP